jgi:hypothetical protein
MSDPRKTLQVRLSASDLVPVIQKKGAEQRANVSGAFTHYAYDQANLMLAAEDLYSMLSRVVKEAKRAKGKNPLGSSLSDALLTEATELLERVHHNEPVSGSA